MSLARAHRRLAVLMSLASLLAFVGGAGVEALSATLATAGLLLALFWQPSEASSVRMERIWLPLALLLVARALFQVIVIRGDVVIPVVDLLFLLLVAEALRSLEARNDVRLYSLSFALLLAATAYRPGLLFLVAFLAYVALGTLALIFGHLRREGERHGVTEIRVPRSFLLTATALSGATLVVAIVVFITFPRVSRGWAGRGETMATSLAGFADEVSLGAHGSRIYGNPQIVLRVEFPQGAPANVQSLYWRGRSYDHFDGQRWSKSPRIPPSLAPEGWYHRWGRERVTQRIYGAPLNNRVLFALHPLIGVEPESRIQPVFDNSGDQSYWGTGPPAYTAHSIQGRPSPAWLREAEEGFVPARDFFTQLPPLSPEVRSLADSLLAHLPSDYDRAETLVAWFREEFTYTLDLPRTAGEARLEHFLLARRAGHCEYFSTAMAVLLRTQGIPVREVNGFLGGSWSPFGDYLAVTQNQAHAWVEVWFPGLGWVPFDPTPAGRGETMADTSWFWPGRFLFDAIQHKWGKWVLDYSFQDQFTLLELVQEALTRARRNEADRPGGRDWGGLGRVGWWILATVLTLGAAVGAFRRRRPDPQETRTYLRLREAVRKRGAPASALHSPMSLAGYLESAQHPAAPTARRVVDGYLQARFSGFPTREETEQALARDLKNALALLEKKSYE